MEIIDSDKRPVLLSNYEVLLMINDRQAAREKRFANAMASKLSTVGPVASAEASGKKTTATRRATRGKELATVAVPAVPSAAASRQQQQASQNAYHLPLPRNVATLELELQKYLQESTCANYTKKSVQSLLTELSKFPLTKAERLQILNIAPTNTAVLYPLIEEMEERLTEEQMEEIVELVNRILPEPPQQSKAATTEQE